ncbi:type VI secretion system protein ImpG [Sinobacterium caligoides]|uniref:Type VI secretion system protein ImpG n=1 Tax=Sinobacterium caligoides TaxID=933926 RepID=A0A3N2DL20_9GAMM|nr:type VI secretion system baseplate subunit TssF [Sinobacterium caligoides]ROS00045.1 type VI secretion system protein ImpG [Sinobacterium caligoides]
MTDKLLPYYEHELAFLQQTAGEFAQRHPSVASSLSLDSNTVDDPLVAKLLSGAAYLNARIQQRLDDDFPQITDALMGYLYPHYQRPIPSMGIVQFTPLDDLQQSHIVKSGTVLETEAIKGHHCQFTTGYDAHIEPFKVVAASLQPRPFIAPGSDQVIGANAVLQLSLKTLSDECLLSDEITQRLRFHLAGQVNHVVSIYDLILTKSVTIILASSENDPDPIFLDRENIQQVGFDSDDGLLPYPDNVLSGYRLLTEYFCFTERFLFFDIIGIKEKITEKYTNNLNIYIYLDESIPELESQVDSSFFALNCAPIINLFEQSADPISLKHDQYSYELTADVRRKESLEIYSINAVSASNNQGTTTEYSPFYGITHTQSSQHTFWHAERKEVYEGDHGNELATDMNINFVDLDFNPHHSHDQVIATSITCFNRNLAKKLPNSAGQPYLSIVDDDAPTQSIHCVSCLTPTIRPSSGKRSLWRLYSHLNLNHLSISDSSGESLKEILRLYNFKDTASTRNQIESIQKIRTRAITAPITTHSTTAMCRGTEVTITLNKQMLAGTSPLIFATVIERFLGLYCSINSFIQLSVKFSDSDKELKRWPPRAGDKALL